MDQATVRHQDGKGAPQDASSTETNGGGQPKQEDWRDAKAFYDNLSPQKKPKSVSEIIFFLHRLCFVCHCFLGWKWGR